MFKNGLCENISLNARTTPTTYTYIYNYYLLLLL